MIRGNWRSAALWVLVLAPVSVSRAQFRVVELDPTAQDSEARGVSNEDRVVGFTGLDPESPTGILWEVDSGDNVTSTLLGSIGGEYSLAQDVCDSRAGAEGFYIVGRSEISGNSADPMHTFRWSLESPSMLDLGTLCVAPLCDPAGCYSEGFGISPSGDYITGESNVCPSVSAVTRAFRYDGATFWAVPLPLPSADLSSAGKSVTNDGNVAGWLDLDDPSGAVRHAFYYYTGVSYDLGTLAGTSCPLCDSEALDVNAGNQVVGWSETGGPQGERHAFLFEPGVTTTPADGTMADLGTLGGFSGSSEALAINSCGVIVGQSDVSGSESHAFMYRDGVMLDLNDFVETPGWTLVRATGINDHGRISGWGVKDGESRNSAFLLKPQLRIEFVDPVLGCSLKDGDDDCEDLLQGSSITTKGELLAVRGTPVEGLCADGATKVLVRVETPGSGAVVLELLNDAGNATTTAELGKLKKVEDPDSAGTLTTAPIDTAQYDGHWFAFAILMAPEDFSRGAGDSSLASRELIVRATYTSDVMNCFTVEPMEKVIDLYRPPLALLHGIWGSDGSWGYRWLRSDVYSIYRHSYKPYSAYEFALNVEEPAHAVYGARSLMRHKGVACTKVDLICHSMGGILSRIYIATGNYERPDNFGKGDVHKFITVDTPHYGSPWYGHLVGNDDTENFLGMLWRRFMNQCVDCGALRDMDERTHFGESVGMASLPATNVPSHAIIGTGADNLCTFGGSIHWSLRALKLLLCSAVPWLTTASEGWLDFVVFDGAEHDVAVKENSQYGGMQKGTSFTTKFPGFWEGVHFGIGVTSHDDVADRLAELLDAQVAGSSFRQSGFPGPARPSVAHSPIQDPTCFFEGALEVTTSPEVLPGAMLPVYVTNNDPAFAPESVTVFCEYDSETVESWDGSTTQVLLEIPLEAMGEFTVEAVAYGNDCNADTPKDDPTTVSALMNGSLLEITINPNPLFLFHFSKPTAFSVTARFTVSGSDVDRDLLRLPGTVVQVDDPSIASLDCDGLLVPHTVGATFMTVSNPSLPGEQVTGEVVVVTADTEYTPPTGGEGFVFTAPNIVVDLDADPSFAVDLTITDSPCGPSLNTTGFTMGLGHDPAMLEARLTEPAADLLAVRGGTGPEVFISQILPGGITVGVVYDLGLGETMIFDTPKEVVTVTYEALPLPPAITNGSTRLTWTNGLADPRVRNEVLLDTASRSATYDHGWVFLEQLPPLLELIRGDCNSDRDVDVSDCIYMLNELFTGGPPSTCVSACDSNDDGRYDLADPIYLLNYRFRGGPEPPAPFPDCGVIAGGDCASSPCMQ